MASILNQTQELQESSKVLGHVRCENYFIFPGESSLSDGLRGVLYFLGLAYCFIGLSAITARFFKSMENVVKHSRKVVSVDPITKDEVITYKKVWNFTIADISLLAFGTSFPQISLATIDAIRNIGERYAGGLYLVLCSSFQKTRVLTLKFVNSFIYVLSYRSWSWDTCWLSCI